MVQIMEESKKYRNYEKTEIAIKNALLKLYSKENKSGKISVKELCEFADISKSTFYLHYADIESIFESVGSKFLSTFKDMFQVLSTTETSYFTSYIDRVIDFVSESNDIIKLGLKLGKPLNYYIDGIKMQLEKTVYSSPLFNSISIDKDQIVIEGKIVASGIIDFIIDLLRNGEYKELKKYSSSINTFLNKWIQSMTESKR